MSLYENFKRNLREVIEKAKRDGPRATVIAAIQRAKDNPGRWILLRGRPPKYQTTSRVDLKERWELMSAHIPQSAENALDIGCYQGVISKKIAEEGLLTFGFERKENRVLQAREETKTVPNCHIFRWDVQPNNIKQLPSFDVVFLLTVYYHWVDQHGSKDAEKMLQQVVNKADILFIQTPEQTDKINSKYLNKQKETPDKKILQQYFIKILDSVQVDYLGSTAYKGGDRSDAIYLVK